MNFCVAFKALSRGVLFAIQPSYVVPDAQQSSQSFSSSKRKRVESDDENAGPSDSSTISSDLAASADGVQEHGTDSNFHPHAREFDVAMEKHSIQERIIHFLSPENINHITRCSVERAILIEAGTIVTDDKTTDSASRNTLMLSLIYQSLMVLRRIIFSRM